MQQRWKGLGTYGTVGLEFALSVLFGLLGGQWLDRRLDTSPWLAVIGLGFGLAAGGRSIWRALQRANREAEEFERKDREARRKFNDRDDGQG